MEWYLRVGGLIWFGAVACFVVWVTAISVVRPIWWLDVVFTLAVWSMIGTVIAVAVYLPACLAVVAIAKLCRYAR